MKSTQITKGNGGECAYCGKTPTAKFTYSTKLVWFAWACNESHAKLAFTNNH